MLYITVITIFLVALATGTSPSTFQHRFSGLSYYTVPEYTGKMVKGDSGIAEKPFKWTAERAIRNYMGQPAAYNPRGPTDVSNKFAMELKNSVTEPHTLMITTTLPACELDNGVYVPVRMVHMGVKVSVDSDDNGNEEWVFCTENGGWSFGVVGGDQVSSDIPLIPTTGDATTTIVASYDPSVEGTGVNAGKFFYVVYQDGVEVGSTFLEFTGVRQVLYTDWNEDFTGDLKEITFWDQSISADHVSTLYEESLLPQFPQYTGKMIKGDSGIATKPYKWTAERAIRNYLGQPAGYSPRGPTNIVNKFAMELKNSVKEPHALMITTTLPACQVDNGAYVPVRMVHMGVKVSVDPNDNGNEEWVFCTETGGWSFGVVGGDQVSSDIPLTPTTGDAVTYIVAVYDPSVEGTGANAGKFFYAVYQDGVELGSAFVKFTGIRQVLYTDWNDDFNGDLKAVTYWDQSLSADQVSTIFDDNFLPEDSDIEYEG